MTFPPLARACQRTVASAELICTALEKIHAKSTLLLTCVMALCAPASLAVSDHTLQSATAMPAEVTSPHFTVTIAEGSRSQSVPVVHAAENYYFLDFDLPKRATVTVTADRDDYWAHGVDVQPWRLGIRPEVHGRSITFPVRSPAKISITRPGDFLGGADMLFLFAETKRKDAPKPDTPGIRYFSPGVHRENIDAHTGDRIYLAPGAVIFGAINVWEVEDVRIFGRGVVIYDGPQNPADDDGWMHKPNWHAIVMHNAHNIRIEGITCVVRSRTWMIQMKDSRDVHFDNIKVIGGSPGNANQDGMDWLGGGDTTVTDSFFRAADDVFAMQGNWEGYSAEAFAIPGHEVSNITIERSVLSTSISNIVRSAWPRKSFDSHHFVMRDSDVLHMGIGGCGVPFALLAMWANPEGTGHHSDYAFENIRLDDWYSLVQLQQPAPGISDIRFRDIFALEAPSLVRSSLLGSVSGVVFDNVTLGNRLVKSEADVPLTLSDGAVEPTFGTPAQTAHAVFTFAPGAVSPGQKVVFDASPSQAGEDRIKTYEWSFGDGTSAKGKRVRHAFADVAGTLQDGSGRFRVLLHTVSAEGRNSWAYEPVVVASKLQPAVEGSAFTPGLRYKSSAIDEASLTALQSATESGSGVAGSFDVSSRPRDEHYGMSFDGLIEVPRDGGYTFTLLSNDAGHIEVDATDLGTTPAPWPQVCGSLGNAVRPVSGSIGLRAGRHRIHVAMTHSVGEDGFAVLWQGPGLEIRPVPAQALSHRTDDAATNTN